MGLDATKPIESEPLRYTVVSIPGEEDETLIEKWVNQSELKVVEKHVTQMSHFDIT